MLKTKVDFSLARRPRGEGEKKTPTQRRDKHKRKHQKSTRFLNPRQCDDVIFRIRRKQKILKRATNTNGFASHTAAAERIKSARDVRTRTKTTSKSRFGLHHRANV
jgi:hypothetical protein